MGFEIQRNSRGLRAATRWLRASAKSCDTICPRGRPFSRWRALSSFRMGAAMSTVVRGMMHDDVLKVIRCQGDDSRSRAQPARKDDPSGERSPANGAGSSRAGWTTVEESAVRRWAWEALAPPPQRAPPEG